MSDDVISDAAIESANTLADNLTTDLVDDIENDSDEDVAAVVFGVWCNLTRYLAAAGWTSEELARDAAHHAADQGGAEGRA